MLNFQVLKKVSFQEKRKKLILLEMFDHLVYQTRDPSLTIKVYIQEKYVKCIFQIENNEVDLGVPGREYCTYMKSKVVFCAPATSYGREYFFTRYPLETSKLFNLKNLLTPGSWFAYFITIIFVIISLKLSCYIGVRLGLNTVTEEIALVPFRFIKHTFQNKLESLKVAK